MTSLLDDADPSYGIGTTEYMRSQGGYAITLECGQHQDPAGPEVAYQAMHSIKAGIKDALSPQFMFTDLGLKYVGPIDGHDEHAVESALRSARDSARATWYRK